MGWIKRNLLFTIGGLIALLLLGAAGYYIFQGWSSNAAAAQKLDEIYNGLGGLSQKNPSPGNNTIDNTQIAKDQETDVQAWIQSSGKYFQPVTAIPPGKVTSETFAAALRKTIDQLQHEADDNAVLLPPKYDFSFSAQRSLVRFAGNLDPLAQQLGEVKAISEIIFASKVNALDGIQRVRVSEDDAGGPQADYISDQPITNDLAVLTPYVVTFRSFTPELSRVISAFATSTNAFIIKSINIQPAGAAGASSDNGVVGGPNGMPGMPPPRFAPGYLPPGAQLPGNPGAQPLPGKGGLQTVLKEQLLRITLEVDLVKLLPKS